MPRGFVATTALTMRTAMGIEIQPVHPDRSKIELDDETVARHWTKHLGASKEEIGAAIEKVGNNPETVRKDGMAASPK
jgi:hypothetical protein